MAGSGSKTSLQNNVKIEKKCEDCEDSFFHEDWRLGVSVFISQLILDVDLKKNICIFKY